VPGPIRVRSSFGEFEPEEPPRRLAVAARVMARVQVGQTLSPEAVTEIVDFLETLGGPVPGHYGPQDSG